jgi:dolichol-phosphate mannosyltransferase
MNKIIYSIIIPTYNEAGNIRTLITGINSSLPVDKTEIIVVDDNSPDNTWMITRNLKINNVKVIRRTHVRGLCSAIQEGIDNSNGKYIGWMDSDLSHPPALLSKMAYLITKYDAIIPSRYIQRASDRRMENNAVILSWLINKMCNTFIYKNITDYTSGYIFLKKQILETKRLEGDYGEYFIDLVYYLNQNNFHIIEIPYIMYSRIHGASKTATNIFDYIKRGRKYIQTLLRCIYYKHVTN